MAERRHLQSAVLTCGGTGGHVYPAIAIAREILARDPAARVSFVGRPDSYEQRVLEREGFEVDTVEIGRLVGQSLVRRIRTAGALPLAVVRAGRVLRRRRPEVVIGTGGFVSGPTMLAAAALGLPTLVQEQNAAAGVTNRVLRRLARGVALAQAPASGAGRLPHRHVVTGNPVRPAFFAVPEWTRTEPPLVLVMGGSQGARRLNEIVVDAVNAGALSGRNLRVVVQCGPRWQQAVADRLAGARDAGRGVEVEVEVVPYLEDVPRRLAEATLVVCRAGASTVSELAAAGRPAILVPFPHAAGDHQTLNARAFEDERAVVLAPENALDGERLARLLVDLLDEPGRLEAMSAAMRALSRPDAAARIVDLAEDVRADRGPRAAAASVIA